MCRSNRKNKKIDVNELLYIMHKYLDFTSLSRRENLSEAFIEEFQNEVDWDYINEYQFLSEDFIRKFKDKINWEVISYSQKLSENFIEEFQNRVDWFEIIENQDISNEFIEKMKEKIKTHLWVGMDIYTSAPFEDKKYEKVILHVLKKKMII